MTTKDEHLSRAFSASCEDARDALLKHMTAHGLRLEDGWTIHEFTRQVEGRTELIMRPLHRQLPAPTNLECLCMIDEPGAKVGSECREQATPAKGTALSRD
jgi:hypothetical protein